MMKDEYLDVLQVAYLLKYTDSKRVRILIQEGQLKAYKGSHNGAKNGKKKILIKTSDLVDYSRKKLNRYKNYYDFKEAENKASYWDNSNYKGRRIEDEDTYISCSQMAYLLGVKRQAVFKAIAKGSISVELININGKQKKLITVNNLIEYADEKLTYYSRLIAYLNAEDKLKFWKGVEDEQI